MERLPSMDPEFFYAYADDSGQIAIGIRLDGTVYVAQLSEIVAGLQQDAVQGATESDNAVGLFGFADQNGAVALAITAEGVVVGNFEPKGLSAVSTYLARAPQIQGLNILGSACKLRYGGVAVDLADLKVAPATSVSETVKDYPLAYIAPITMPVQEFLKLDAAQWLGYSSVAIESVVNQSTGATLTPGVDYAYTENGKLALINSGPAISATVKFVGYKERYDLVAYNLVSQSLVIRQGTERRITAHEDLYRAKPQSGDIPLYSVYVVGSRIQAMIDVSEWRGVRNRESGAEQVALRQQNRYRLRRFITKLNRGDGVIVTGYGDSNTALGGARGDDSAYLPNRPNVDTYVFQGDYLLSAFEADFRVAYLAAVGQVTVNGQVRYKTSPNWSVIDKICSGYGYKFAADRNPGSREVVYLNQGIATSTSGNTAQGGTTPARLAAMLNPAGYRTPDLVIVAFGMNDRTDAAYVSNIEQIITAAKNAGADVIVVGPHLTNTFSASFTKESWHLVQRRLMECADRMDVAFMPCELFYAGKNRGYTGLSDYSLTRANFANHPGPSEYRMFGEALASSFL
ncbi:hypothetical protein H4C80_20160 [Pseudomonas juntendi]|uniref:SGNH hydrolase-type esterase domain-containing protein n=1 Tax=Pseudomonas juntendi TaxID=2666183 RepID=A0A7W2KJ38_9PSED|nr:SGNH/GDSL hydrolase family protein [Pseudomonas juntendi]MBA6099421.1 hypothetical protein [Pseudomonas juntendi]